MSENQYRVIARAPDRDEETYDKVGTALSRTFQLDVTEVAIALGTDGVEVCRVASFEEGRVYAKRVRDLGADSLVVDPTGKVVEQTGSPRSRASDELGRTMMGGFQAPADEGWSAPDDDAIDIGFVGKEGSASAPTPVVPPPRVEEDLISLDDSGGRSALPDLVPEGAPSPPAAPPPAAAPPAAAPAFGGFDNLGDDALVMLDGSADEPEPPPPQMEMKREDGTTNDFAPPAEDEVLELDEAPRTHKAGVSSMDPDAASGGPVPEAEEAPPAQEAASAADVEWEPAEGEAGPSLAPVVSPPPPVQAQRTAETRVPPRGWRGAIRRSHSPLELPRELAREFPRIRIIVGFVLALALGSIAPTCYSSVLEKRAQPLLVDLSTAKAHGQLLMGLPHYRSPEQIQEEIDSLTSRHAAYGFIMWLLISGGLGFLWFRFVRAD